MSELNRSGDADDWLSRDPLPPDPVAILDGWLREAFAAQLQPNPHAVALATIDPDGRPSVRMVLCKEIDRGRGAFTMYTKYQSRKGRALALHRDASLVFYWGPQNRQARVDGKVEFTAAAQSDAYFASRPLDAQLGAWASRQSEPVESRAALIEAARKEAARFDVSWENAEGAPADPSIPRPPHWGGYDLIAESIELWVSRPGRIHDRACWERDGDGSPWRATRLQP